MSALCSATDRSEADRKGSFGREVPPGQDPLLAVSVGPSLSCPSRLAAGYRSKSKNNGPKTPHSFVVTSFFT